MPLSEEELQNKRPLGWAEGKHSSEQSVARHQVVLLHFDDLKETFCFTTNPLLTAVTVMISVFLIYCFKY